MAFFQTIAAVFIANVATFVFVYALIQYTKLERAHGDLPQGGGRYIAIMLATWAFAFFSLLNSGLY